MKLHYSILLLAVIAVAVFLPAQQVRAQAGDTLLVEWADPSTGEVAVDALRNTIETDTLRPEGRVYKLQKGGFYWITETIVNDGWHLRIVGETPGAGEFDNPAVLQMVARNDGTVNGRMITGGADITFKNLFIIGCDNNGVQTYYQPIQIDASDSRFVFDNIILERTNFALIAFTGKNNDIFYTNCKFRNLIGQPSTQQWEGRGISIWADQDTVVVENCTFFNIGFMALQVEGGAANYLRFNHNTLVNVGRGIHAGNWWREGYFANNLLVNQWWHGEGNSDLSSSSRDPRATNSGIFAIGALPSMYGPEEGRRIVFTNAASWRDPAFTTFYGDSIAQQYFVNPVTQQDFLDLYTAMVVKDTTWLSAKPSLGTYPDNINDMIQNINELRTGVTPAQPYFWNYPQNLDGTDNYVGINWPLPEDFSYTDVALLTAGTDDLPLGDLNWFPTQKAQWEANKDQNVTDIEDMAGPKIELNVIADYQAEDGTLGGDAVVENFQGFSYFQMDGGGYLEWTFDLTEAGQYDLNVWTHMRGNATRGERIFVNGVSIHDPKGWGEYIWDSTSGVHEGMETNAWTWTLITQANILEAGALTLPAGTNTIRIEASWGWQNFAGIDLLMAGTSDVAKSLRAPDVTDYAIVTPQAEGAAWVPVGFKSVVMNTNGTVTWTMDIPSDGKYRLQVFFQNYMDAQTVEILVDGVAAVLALPLASEADSTGLSKLSDSFDMTAGSHEVTLASNDVRIDYVQLIQEISTSVKKRNELPAGFALMQNYPNPFNPTTKINFSLGKVSNVNLTIYNVLGQKVITLIDKRMGAGDHSVQFDASKFTSGIYFYRIKAGDFKSEKKMLFIK